MTKDDNIGILDPEGKNKNPINNKEYSKTYKELAKGWSELPAYQNAKDIINQIKENQVILITSGTGSGKTVLLPKYALHVLDYKGHIAVTLPKQIIAKSSAEYAALTLDVLLGIDIGYQYKGSDEMGRADNPKILYATDGTIVAKLLKDPLIKDLDCVIIDEAHERKVQIDFLLYLLKHVVSNRPEFKIIIMSATVNSEIFVSYFAEYKFKAIDIGGKTNYPIQSIFLDRSISKYEYINKGLEIINYLRRKNESGKVSDILFFVCSVNETLDVCKRIKNQYRDVECIEVYSGISDEKQEQLKTKTTTNQRIIISTNVAESSLTIDGIKYIIDSGYEFLSYYDADKRARVLEKKLISQAQAKQRMGRAGRTQPGICYHLYSENDFNNIMIKYPEPSIRLSDITTESVRLMGLEHIRTTKNLLKIYSEFIEPPREKYIRMAVDKMISLGVIEDYEINELGQIISDLQMDIEQGICIYAGYNLNCIREIIAILTMLECSKGLNDIFVLPLDRRADKNLPENKLIIEKFNKKRDIFRHKYGDHLSLLQIYNLVEGKSDDELKDIAEDNYMKYSTLIKVNETYNRNFNRVMEIFGSRSRGIEQASDKRSREKIVIDKLMDYDVDYRIIASLLFGFKLNIGYYKDDFYRTDYVDKAKISKESYMNIDKPPKTIFYNELFITNNENTLNIISTIPIKSKELYEKFVG
jgi:pre-mRNA-splicing factor ATP-dependent RNA helicase DHX15/PRP43